MYRILVVDDEQKLREAIGKYARFEGYDTIEATDGLEAVELCKNNTFDLILLDVMLPKLDGVSACREIRKFSDTPIIMLTARGDEYDRIVGFEAGADDYVVKPFSPKELILRIAALLKRNRKNVSQTLTYEGIVVDLPARSVEIDGARVELTAKEFDLLVTLLKNPGIVLSRQTLIKEVWGKDADMSTNRTLDTHIKQVRKALGTYSGRIVTVRGIGYRLEKAQI
ncbi:MAG: response regulator transcription factor [Oscillospiraceae bacterium]|jgi:two-component system response regulator ResD